MSHQGKTIITYLIDGNPTGLKITTFSNRLIKGISIPRKTFKEAIEQRTELQYSGIYFLIGEDEEGNHMAYIGQATVLAKRLNDHYRDSSKDFWNNAICFTNNDGSLNESDINYLEKEIIQAAKTADRYKIINNTSGNKGLIQEYRVSDMIEFVEDLKILINNLGYFVLSETITKKDNTIENIYYLTGRGSDAKGTYTEEGFVIFKGSKGPISMVNDTINNKRYAYRNRPKLLSKGIIKEEGEFIYFLKDHTFNSPSAAADIVLGRNSNGRTERKTKDGKTMDEMIRKNINL